MGAEEVIERAVEQARASHGSWALAMIDAERSKDFLTERIAELREAISEMQRDPLMVDFTFGLRQALAIRLRQLKTYHGIDG